MSKVDIAILGGSLFGRSVDLLVGQGRILEVADAGAVSAPENATVLKARGMVLLPSLVDAHVHLREPGQEYKETIATGLEAAAHGGFGRIMCMANTKPINDTAAVTRLMLEKARQAHPHGPHLHPIGALTVGLKGEQLAPLAELAQSGCAAFSNDGLPVADAERFRRALEYAATVGRTVIDHCEEPTMAPAAGINEGDLSGRLGLRGQPDVAEAMQVARDCLLAEYLKIPVHLAHVSCEKSVDLIRLAKARGAPVTAETCPHYLFLTEDACDGYDTRAKVNPPLRTAVDVTAMRTALADGTIDILSTDHAPHAEDEKDTAFDLAPCGISGLDAALALTWELVASRALTQERFVDAWHTRPSKIFGLPANTFEPGDPADIVLFDPDRAWILTKAEMRSKGKNTPFEGRQLKGRVMHHVIDGNVLF